MEYIKKLLTRLFKIRGGAFKTITRVFVVYSDDEYQKRLQKQKWNAFAHHHHHHRHYTPFYMQEYRPVGFQLVGSEGRENNQHVYVSQQLWQHPIEDDSFDLSEITTVRSQVDDDNRMADFDFLKESQTISL